MPGSTPPDGFHDDIFNKLRVLSLEVHFLHFKGDDKLPTSSGSNPTGDLQRVPADEYHHEHPKVVLLDCSTPFTLLPGPNNQRTIVFQNPSLGQDVRVFVMGFSGNFPESGQPSNVRFRQAVTLRTGESRTYVVPGGADKLWVGAWWTNDSRFDDSESGNTNYFNDHPVGSGGHHTVPVITG